MPDLRTAAELLGALVLEAEDDVRAAREALLKAETRLVYLRTRQAPRSQSRRLYAVAGGRRRA